MSHSSRERILFQSAVSQENYTEQKERVKASPFKNFYLVF